MRTLTSEATKCDGFSQQTVPYLHAPLSATALTEQGLALIYGQALDQWAPRHPWRVLCLVQVPVLSAMAPHPPHQSRPSPRIPRCPTAAWTVWKWSWRGRGDRERVVEYENGGRAGTDSILHPLPRVARLFQARALILLCIHAMTRVNLALGVQKALKVVPPRYVDVFQRVTCHIR